MNFRDLIVFKEDRFTVGQEVESGRFYLSIPVSNGFADYEEYFELTALEYSEFSKSINALRLLVRACMDRKEDARLLIQPGHKRGEPG